MSVQTIGNAARVYRFITGFLAAGVCEISKFLAIVVTLCQCQFRNGNYNRVDRDSDPIAFPFTSRLLVMYIHKVTKMYSVCPRAPPFLFPFLVFILNSPESTQFQEQVFRTINSERRMASQFENSKRSLPKMSPSLGSGSCI